MSTASLPSDEPMVDLLRQHGPTSIAQLAESLEVTATAVRQRLGRLMAAGLVARETVRHGRGRPVHVYQLTPKAMAQQGSNFADLAVALWREIAAMEPGEVRTRLLQRVFARLSEQYRHELAGETLPEKLKSLRWMLRERGIAFDVVPDEGLPILSTHQCPYPGLADEDPSICEMERELFSKIVGEHLTLTHCRATGDACCSFVPQGCGTSS
jgi:predicted ArsR family transcriptional regulator